MKKLILLLTVFITGFTLAQNVYTLGLGQIFAPTYIQSDKFETEDQFYFSMSTLRFGYQLKLTKSFSLEFEGNLGLSRDRNNLIEKSFKSDVVPNNFERTFIGQPDYIILDGEKHYNAYVQNYHSFQASFMTHIGEFLSLHVGAGYMVTKGSMNGFNNQYLYRYENASQRYEYQQYLQKQSITENYSTNTFYLPVSLRANMPFDNGNRLGIGVQLNFVKNRVISQFTLTYEMRRHERQDFSKPDESVK